MQITAKSLTLPNALWRRIQRLTHKRLQIYLCVEMQRINGTPFLRQKCTPSPHKQPQVNVMDLCFCIKDVIIHIYLHLYFHCLSLASISFTGRMKFIPRWTPLALSPRKGTENTYDVRNSPLFLECCYFKIASTRCKAILIASLNKFRISQDRLRTAFIVY